MKFNKKVINKKISIYYKNKPSDAIITEVVNCFDSKNSFNQPIKKGKGRSVFKCEIDNYLYYFKKYNYKTSYKKVKNIFRKPSSYRTFKKIYKLLENDIPVVYPILAAVRKDSFLKQESILVTKDFDGLNLQDLMLRENFSISKKRRIIRKVAKLWASLYNNNFINADPNLGSIIVKLNDKSSVALVDIDDIKEYPFLPRKLVLKNLVDFNAHTYSGLGNSNKGQQRLNFKDRICFLDSLLKFYKKENFNIKKDSYYIKEKTLELLSDWNKLDLV